MRAIRAFLNVPTHTCYHSTEEYGISEVEDEQGNPVKKGWETRINEFVEHGTAFYPL